MGTLHTSPKSNRRVWTALAAAAGAADHTLLSDLYRSASVTVHPDAGGSASLATSCRTPEDIEAGNADWVDVDFGGQTVVTAPQGTEIPVSVTAIRLSATLQSARAFLSGVI